ncbi:MAG: tRNA (adenosine(37)-N6)-threonylcarbamoyltransferase complex transferase subunit TsaD [Saprospiraceae bacterium]
MKPSICILAIESSCDDTSVAIIKDGIVVSNVVHTQLDHSAYGGVVPELASRHHTLQILPVVQQAVTKADISLTEISAIAFTTGPGLLGSLIVGVSFAKGLALSLNLPMIEVHHMHAHIFAHFAEEPKPTFPFLCLTVSGGHTQIVLVESFSKLTILGSTRDDAAGEALDKAGKMLGLSYPAGPIIDKLSKDGVPKFTFPIPKIPDFDFSFSGLKTSILYFLRDAQAVNPNFISENLNDLCASIQSTVVTILMEKLEHAVHVTKIKTVAIAGGVSANSQLRQALKDKKEKAHWNVFIPALSLCTDNAGMVGITAYYKYLEGEFVDQSISPQPRKAF